jgi:hypothetical protein
MAARSRATRKTAKGRSKKANGLGDVLHFRGSIEMELRSAYDGSVLDRRAIHNTIVTAGRKWALSRLVTNDANTLGFIAVGTSTTAPTTGDTGLTSENTRTAGTLNSGQLTSNPPNVNFTCQFATNQANTTLGEAGLFDSSSAGTMFSHVTFSTINKTTSNTLSITYTITA